MRKAASQLVFREHIDWSGFGSMQNVIHLHPGSSYCNDWGVVGARYRRFPCLSAAFLVPYFFFFPNSASLRRIVSTRLRMAQAQLSNDSKL